MAPERRAFIERRRRAITPGHWNCVGLHPHAGSESLLTVRPNGGVWFTNEDDAYFVAAAPEFVDELLAEIDRLTAALQQVDHLTLIRHRAQAMTVAEFAQAVESIIRPALS